MDSFPVLLQSITKKKLAKKINNKADLKLKAKDNLKKTKDQLIEPINKTNLKAYRQKTKILSKWRIKNCMENLIGLCWRKKINLWIGRGKKKHFFYWLTFWFRLWAKMTTRTLFFLPVISFTCCSSRMRRPFRVW